jgi:hypothetical protein
MDANLGVPFWMLDWQNSYPNALIGTLSGFSLQDLSRAKRTSG